MLMDEQIQNNQVPQDNKPQPEPNTPVLQNTEQALAGNDLGQQPNQTANAPQNSQQTPAEDQELQNNQPQPEQWQHQSGNLAQPEAINDQSEQPKPTTSGTDSISWSASEFMHHEKSSGWYIVVALVFIVLAAVIYFLTKEIFSAAAIILIAIAFAVFGALKPKVLEYSIGPDGIQAGAKRFSYEEFRSFAVITEGVLPSIQLLPHKRFALAITMYCDPEQAEKIIEILGEYLPFEHRDRDFTDKLASKIHF